MAKAVWNIMYKSEGGHDEHLQVEVEAETAAEAVAGLGRTAILTALEAAGAKAKFAGQPAAAPQQQYQSRPAAPAPTGAAARTCPQGHPMKFVNAGVSRASGKAYPAFYTCESGCVGNNGRKYSENA